ncbi:uncharacterized protein LOC126802057 [Argentina anserina]|uniref:uncharacterized protein LOC126802057 n=1 Tax=Argentina anserina TaxID=57926 RepID=UPI0021766D4A|nr:uncharacterized protein LOC126802057 [Potentilla anserina]
MVKINVDAAWKATSSHSGIGACVRNYLGASIAGRCSLGSFNSALEAEAEVVVNGVNLAASLSLKKVIVEGDCRDVMLAMSEEVQSANWKIQPMVRKVQSLLHLFDQIEWNWVPRDANHLADAAAKMAMSELCSLDWDSCPPTSLSGILRADGLPGPP